MRVVMARAADSSTTHFVLTLDVVKAHRRIRIREKDWGLQTCRLSRPDLWVNRVGTFGVGSSCYWWSRLGGLLSRAVSAFLLRTLVWQLLYADDVFWDVSGPQKFRDLLLAVLLWEALGTPVAWKKVKGGFATDWLGYWVDYTRFELGISDSRAKWLTQWLERTLQVGSVLVRDLRETLGRIGFAAGVLEWHRPFLAPLYAWVAVAPSSAFLPLPPAVKLALLHLRDRFQRGLRTTPCRRPVAEPDKVYFADAGADGNQVTMGGWEAVLGQPLALARWFSITIRPDQAPWLFPDGTGARRIAAAELLATLACVVLFSPPGPARARGTVSLSSAFTDNRGNSYAAAKLLTTKFPLSCIVMELATQMEIRQMWVDLAWTPREQNTLADKLASPDPSAHADFSPSRRVADD